MDVLDLLIILLTDSKGELLLYLDIVELLVAVFVLVCVLVFNAEIVEIYEGRDVYVINAERVDDFEGNDDDDGKILFNSL